MSHEAKGKSFCLTIDGEPVAQGRPQFVRRTGVAYDPPKSRDYKKKVNRLAQKRAHDDDWQLFDEGEPLKVKIHFRLRRGKTVDRVWPIVRPDIDNYAKAIMDALEGVVYANDKQVVALILLKFYAEIGDAPQVLVIVEPIDKYERPSQ